MNEHDDRAETPSVPRAPEPIEEHQEAGNSRELILMRACGQVFAVFADEADNVTEGLTATPLPHAPPAVLGVVCVRGRMRTVLDPCGLVGENFQAAGDERDSLRRFFVSLRGDEQLALSVERVERIVEVADDSIEAPGVSTGAVRGVLAQDDSFVTVLDPARMFEAAMQGTDRRRQRQK
ncbi:MAG TPA: chemotaxis protein CheW [Pyrinomonadaceae bacterium]|nr:chemotaxis protein CheW [Pyrinomonadaceae bacterium]